MSTPILTPDGWVYNQRQARLEPAEPPAFKPASLLIRAELADLKEHIPGYPGKLRDLISDTRDMANFTTDYQPGVIADILSVWARFGDEIDGMAK